MVRLERERGREREEKEKRKYEEDFERRDRHLASRHDEYDGVEFFNLVSFPFVFVFCPRKEEHLEGEGKGK